ncbi:flagellar motor protein MotB [Tenacibaculum sp. E3R01]|uniref:OmpA family protein n=1 Tax=Tenacibaculum sp. E3R01 TaxID=2267227 RepID=UPI000DE9150B|nr:OmpA family protein [Tenacibaculum sp. E3R01]RBW59302.1 flagellar motor protein MotB [Tenacibaculum sp. E3R01]
MSKKSIYLLGILLTIIIGSILYWYMCCTVCYAESCDSSKQKNQKTSNEEVSKPKTKHPTSLPFSIKDTRGNLAYEINENFNFNTSGFSIRDSVSTSLNNGISMIREYLNSDENKRLNITGYYMNDENNNSAFPNLGLARANSVKNYMVSQNISSKLINTYGELNNDLVANKNNILYGPLKFDIFTRTDEALKSDETLKKACETIKESPLFIYFKTGQASINLTPEQRQKFADISKCVDKLGVIIQVTGHTDNTGNKDGNMKLGLDRANFIKTYLIKNGILSQNITVASEGQNTPISDNTTEEGRAKNRRIEITIN